MHVPKLDGADGLRCRCEYTGVMPRADATVIGAVQCPEAEEFAANLRAVHLRDGIPPKGGCTWGEKSWLEGLRRSSACFTDVSCHANSGEGSPQVNVAGERKLRRIESSNDE